MRLRALAALAVLVAAPARAVEVVRIAVAVGIARASVSGAGLSMTPLQEGASPVPVAGGKAEVTLEDDALRVNGAVLDVAGATFSAEGAIRTGGLPLRGEVEVRRVPAGLVVVDVLPLEDYVASVTGAEMPPSFPAQALQAQAVAARTFALFKKLEAVAEGRPWHLGASVLDQVYRGSRPDPRAVAAARATAGEILVYEHAPIAAYFHSTCGGRTESGADALGRDLPYLKSVPCRWCRDSPRLRWTVHVSGEELGRLVGVGGAVTRARVVARTASGRAARVELAHRGRRVTLAAVDLRQRLGFDRLPSLAFDVRVEAGAVAFAGRGAGHGAGMCQWGAAGAAKQGDSYRVILARYYPGTEIVRMY